MTTLYIGILFFGGIHLFSLLLPAVRNRLKAWWGEQLYMGLYSLVAIAGLALMFWGYGQTRGNGEVLYVPMEGAKHVTMLLVLLGFICISAFHGKGYIKLWLQNPFSIGICLWSIGHLLANGKTPVVLIYVTFLVLALLDIASNMLRGNWAIFEPRVRSDIIAVVVGLVIYALLLLVFHPYVLGVKVAG